MFNRVFIIGNLGADPRVSYTKDGRLVVQFTIATNRPIKKVTGEIEKATDWHRIVVFGRLAEFCQKHLSKGDRVFVEGRLSTRTFDDERGRRTSTSVVAMNIRKFWRAPREEEGFLEPEEEVREEVEDEDIPF